MRRFLTFILSVFFVVGILFTVYPFAASLKPNANLTEFAPIIFDTSTIPPGEYKIIDVFGRPAMIYKPSVESKKYLISLNDIANGPDFNIDNMPDFFVYEPISTYLGCALWDTQEKKIDWLEYDGWFDPCHRGFWDYAGRSIPAIQSGEGLDDLKAVKFEKVTARVIRFKKVLRLPNQ